MAKRPRKSPLRAVARQITRLEDEERAIAALESAAHSENTRLTYEFAWDDFQDWCHVERLSALPAATQTLRRYLYDCSKLFKASSIEVRIAAIRKKHRDAEIPLDLSPLTDLRRGIRKSIGTAKRSKPALTDEQMVRILGRMGGSLPELRDRLILLLGFVGGMRRSEIVGLDIEDLEFKAAGVIATLRQSKGDPEKKGEPVELKAARRAILCPVRALRDWIDTAKLESGPLLREIDRFGFISEGRLHATSVRRIVISRAKAVDIKGVSAHSLRAGAVTSALAAGAKIERVAQHLRHKSIQTTLGYNRRASEFKDNAMEMVLDAVAPDDPLPPVPMVRDRAPRVEFIDFDERATMSTRPIVARRLEFAPVDLDALDAAMRETDAASKRAAAKVGEGS